MKYSYRVKIINKSKRSEFVTRELKTFTGIVETVKTLKLKLMEKLDTLVPSTLDFQVGYFSGKQSKKYWLIEDSDLKEMYDKDSRNSIFLWCDRADERTKEPKRKRSSSHETLSSKSKRVEIEEDIEDTVERIKEVHGDKFSYSQYRIWARLVKSGMFKDISVVPPIPALQGTPQPPKKVRNESLSDVIAGAAVTFVNAVRSPDSSVKAQNSVVINAQSSPLKSVPDLDAATSISPCRATDLRMKKLQELRELQNLLENNILNEAEFIEQKAIVLDSLRKLKQ